LGPWVGKVKGGNCSWGFGGGRSFLDVVGVQGGGAGIKGGAGAGGSWGYIQGWRGSEFEVIKRGSDEGGMCTDGCKFNRIQFSY